jgi:pimeloyl-ACP methyl ester carboxylesterase
MKFIQKATLFFLRLKLNFLSFFSADKAAEKAFVLFCTPQKRSQPIIPTIFKQATPQELVFQGFLIKGFQWNMGKDKRMIVLHGFESSAINFDFYISEGIKAGYEVLAFDAQAHGQSEGETVTIPEYVGLIQAIAAKFGNIHFLIGHSFGGLAVAQYLETVPDQSNVKGVLIAPATETTSAIDGFFKLLQLNKKIRIAFDQLIFNKSGRWPSFYSVRRAIQHVYAPILWIHDKDDKITPLIDVQKVMEDKHPNIEFMITQGLGHRRIYRNKSVQQKVISFF